MREAQSTRSVRLAGLVFVTAAFTPPASATWSVGLLDQRTRTIAVAAASCTFSVYGIAGVIPGAGLVFAQAESNMRARDEAMEGIRRGVENEAILKLITSYEFDPRSAYQQYALLSFREIASPVTFTGNATPDWHGVFSTNGITVQGNALVNREVLAAAYSSLLKAAWSNEVELAQAVVSALAAGSALGGDRRCGETTASSAFVTIFRATDGPQSPFLNLVVRRPDASNRNAVKVLQQRLTDWLAEAVRSRTGKP
jgi:uncharacterized Ntn-hydrolase superfamily protein